MNFIYAIFLSLWRRWFGGGLDFLIDNRFIQHLIGFLACFSILWVEDYHIMQCVVCAGIFQGLFWAKSHGACYDFGHNEPYEERYNQLWYWKYLKKFIPESMRYTFSGDFLLMFVRYTLPALLMGLVLLNPLCCVIGVAVACSYALCWIMYDFGWVKNPTEIAEYMAGFYVGLLLA